MDTIRAYLDSMFAAFPSTPEVRRVYGDLLGAMEDKYNELKAQGKSEQEVIGTVIFEFGSIDELMAELDVEREPGDDSGEDTVGSEEAMSFLAEKARSALLIVIGVTCCILSPVALLVTAGMGGDQWMFGLVLLFVLVAGGVAALVISQSILQPYAYLKGSFVLAAGAERDARREKLNFLPLRTRCIVLGVVLLVLSPLSLILLYLAEIEALYTVAPAVFLVIAAVGAAPLAYMGVIQSGYNMLLQEGDYSPKNKQAEKVIGAVASIWWPVCVAIYLGYSFVTGEWDSSWIIWPISGVLFGAFAGGYSILRGEGE